MVLKSLKLSNLNKFKKNILESLKIFNGNSKTKINL